MNPQRFAFIMIAILFGLVIGLPYANAQPDSSTSPSFNAVEQVSEIRRTIRLACEDLKTAQSDTVRKAELMAAALETTQTGDKLWLGLLSDTAALQSSPYSSHPHWQDSTALITSGMTKMLDLIRAGNPVPAVMACGANCGRFARLNQDAGVYRTSDLLFQIRMTAKLLDSAIQDAQFVDIRAALTGMLTMRDKAMARIEGGTGSEEAKKEGLAEFSKALDAFNQAAIAEDKEALAKSYGELLSRWDQVYSLLL